MAFCTRCGASMSDSTTVCPNCGHVRSAAGSAAPPPEAAYPVLGNVAPATPTGAGFFSALFDFSFTTFVTTKLIKVLYALCIIGAALYALFLVVMGFSSQQPAVGILALIGSAIFFFFAVIYSRVCMELIIVIFRGAEHLAELVRQSRGT